VAGAQTSGWAHGCATCRADTSIYRFPRHPSLPSRVLPTREGGRGTAGAPHHTVPPGDHLPSATPRRNFWFAAAASGLDGTRLMPHFCAGWLPPCMPNLTSSAARRVIIHFPTAARTTPRVAAHFHACGMNSYVANLSPAASAAPLLPRARTLPRVPTAPHAAHCLLLRRLAACRSACLSLRCGGQTALFARRRVQGFCEMVTWAISYSLLTRRQHTMTLREGQRISLADCCAGRAAPASRARFASARGRACTGPSPCPACLPACPPTLVKTYWL